MLNLGADIMELTMSSDIKSDKLKCLYLFQCFMEAKSKNVPKEISLIFHNNKINFRGLQLLPHHISSLTLYISKYSMQLQSLNLRDCHIGDVGMSILEHYFTANPDKASSIKHIDLFGNNSLFLWSVYCVIFGQQNLTKLNWSSLGGVNIEDIVNVMDNNMTVQSLNLSDNHFNDNDVENLVKVLGRNNVLQQLDISNNDITTKGATAISESLQKLQHLKMSWNNHVIDTNHSAISFARKRMNDVDAHIVAKVLYNNETVTKLDLSQNRISKNGAISISKCIEYNKTLKELDLSKNIISNIGLKKIAVAMQANQTLQKYNISHNNISDDGAVAISACLKNNNTLQELNMSHNKVSDNGIANIGKALQMNATLQILDISLNSLSDNGVLTFSDYLEEENTLHQLRISWNGIDLDLNSNVTSINMCKKRFGNTGAFLVSKFFYKTNILKLDISYNNISDDGAVAISKCLKNNNTLQELNMLHNEVCYNGIINIGKALEMNRKLQVFNISANNISDDGAIAISEYLKYSNSLKELNMSHNKVSDNGIINIGKALQMNATLQTLDISHNNLSDNGVLTFSDYLKEENTLHQLRISWNDIDLDLNSNVTSLNMCKKRFGNTGAFLVSKFFYKTNILKLDISYNNISDDGAVAISKCLKNNNTLQELNMLHNEVCDNGIINISKALEMNRKFQVFNISINNISDDGAVVISEYLKYSNSLKELNMSYNKVSDDGIINIGKALQMNATLQVLDISHNRLSDNGVLTFSHYLKEENTLHKLGISWNDIDLDLTFNVTSLNMCKKRFCNTGAILVSKFLYYNLLKLDVSYNDISDDGALAISECIKVNNTLQELNMSHNKVSDYGIINIGKALIQINATLQILDISHNSLSDNGVLTFSDYLKEENTLHKLIISWNDIDLDLNSNVTVCKKRFCNTALILVSKFLYCNTKLDISYNDKSDVGAVSISDSLPELTNIDKALQKKLQILDISHNISDSGVLTFIDYLIDNKKNTFHQLRISWSDTVLDLIFNVTSLNVCKKRLGNTGAIVVSKFLYYNTNILKLDISYNDISDDGAVAISEYLMNNNTLQELNMSHNKLSDNGIIKICKVLKMNRTLKILQISYNSISDDGAVAISECLNNNNTLQELEMSHNKVSDNGIINISKALKMNRTLKILQISHNSISDDGAVAISECLTINNTLQELNLSWNSTTTEGITKIAKALTVNTGLHTLDLSALVNDPVHFTMTLLTAMEHNHTMMRLVPPANVNENEKMIENKVRKVNEERSKEGINKLILDTLRYRISLLKSYCNSLTSSYTLLNCDSNLHVFGPVLIADRERYNYNIVPFQLPIQRSIQRFLWPIQRYQRRRQMLTPIRNVPPPRIRRFDMRARATRHRQRFHKHKLT